MDRKNILSEGLIDWMSKLILGGKVKQLQSKFRKDPKVKNLISDLDDIYDEITAHFKKQGIDVKKPKL